MIQRLGWGSAFLCAAVVLLLGGTVQAEDVDVKYVGAVPLDSFECEDVVRSSFINRLCFDEGEETMILLLNDTYYQFCSVPLDVVEQFRGAYSMGAFFNQEIKGQFDC
jgi:hypothetical protein